MSGHCDDCGNTACICRYHEEHIGFRITVVDGHATPRQIMRVCEVCDRLNALTATVAELEAERDNLQIALGIAEMDRDDARALAASHRQLIDRLAEALDCTINGLAMEGGGRAARRLIEEARALVKRTKPPIEKKFKKDCSGG